MWKLTWWQKQPTQNEIKLKNCLISPFPMTHYHSPESDSQRKYPTENNKPHFVYHIDFIRAILWAVFRYCNAVVVHCLVGIRFEWDFLQWSFTIRSCGSTLKDDCVGNPSHHFVRPITILVSKTHRKHIVSCINHRLDGCPLVVTNGFHADFSANINLLLKTN